MNQWLLTAKSYLALNMLWFYQALCDGLARALDIKISLKQSAYDPLDDPSLRTGEVDLAFICGLPLVRLMRANRIPLQPLAAPVFSDPRGEGKPVYFADVIVRADSSFQTIGDLVDSTFCYNDLGSNSGHHLLRYHLLKNDYPSNFFGAAIQSGSHQHSIERVVDGDADCAAIDSTVLAQAVRDNPELASQIRVIESTSPCPVPPLAFFEREPGMREIFQVVLMKPDAALFAAMEQAGVIRFESVTANDYAIIGEMYDTADGADYHIIP